MICPRSQSLKLCWIFFFVVVSLIKYNISNTKSQTQKNMNTTTNEIASPLSNSTSKITTYRSNPIFQGSLDQVNCARLIVWKVAKDKTIKSTTERKSLKKQKSKVKVDGTIKNRMITDREVMQVLHLPQIQACKILNCSLSTLKRRFYELKGEFGLERWPNNLLITRHLPIFKKIYPMSLDFILNHDD